MAALYQFCDSFVCSKFGIVAVFAIFLTCAFKIWLAYNKGLSKCR